MSKRILCSSALVILGMLINSASISDASAEDTPKFVPGRLLIMPKAGIAVRADLERSLSRLGARTVTVDKELGIQVVEVQRNKEKSIAKAMSRMRSVAFVELDILASPSVTFNDPSASSQWHLAKMHIPEAQDTTTGTNIKVAVLDTGIYAAHPDLSSRLSLPGYNAVDGGTDTSDIYGHGTMVAGVIAAVANNGIGVVGIAPDVTVLPVRVTNRSDALASCYDISRGVVWAADHGAKVANASYGVMGCQTLYNAGQYLMQKGGVLTVSAGNENKDYKLADTPYVITVAATTSSDTKASFSNYGNMVDITAPGAEILTTLRSGSYGPVSGTSFSSPATAGVIALLFASNPSLTPTQIERILEKSSVDLGKAGWDPYFGYGRVDALSALRSSVDPLILDETAPEVAISSPTEGAEVSGTITIDVSVTDSSAVGEVKLYLNGKGIATSRVSPYQFLLNTSLLAAGGISLQASAKDVNGYMGVSAERKVTVKDVSPPALYLTGLSNNSVVTKYKVLLGAAAIDSSGMQTLEIKLDDVTICTWNVTNATRPSKTCYWNPVTSSLGGHWLVLRGVDAADNAGTKTIRVFRK